MSEKDPSSEIEKKTGVETTTLSTSEDGKPLQKQPSLRAEVVVFDNWCKGCRLCVAFCPRDVFIMSDDGKAYVAAPERCTACHWCDTHCPDFAIRVRRLDQNSRRQKE